MAIDGGIRKQLAAGMRLTAKYRKQEYTADVDEGEDGKLRFRLADGREFSSPSAAGSAVMNGVACNGWRFWSLSMDDAETPAKIAAKAKPAAKAARRTKATPDAEPVEPETIDAEPIAVTE